MNRSTRIWIGFLILLFSTRGEGAAADNRFSEEVEALLQRKIQMVRALAELPRIIDLVKESNQKNEKLTLREMYKLDEKWREVDGIDDFIGAFISNECARILTGLQKTDAGFSEIFISDKVGLIVGETNKTSDYYQADEGWWVKAYHKGLGKSYYGGIEYDDSAHAEAIALYVPVMDPETRSAIGVIKAIYNIAHMIEEL